VRNIAGELKIGRFAFEVSHGQGLDLNQAAAIGLSSAERAAGAHVFVPWTTGFGVGVRITRDLHVLVEAKAHHYNVTGNDANHQVDYTTFSVGPGVFYTLHIYKGLFLEPNVRFWPNVASTLKGNQAAIVQSDGSVYEHKAHDFGLFADDGGRTDDEDHGGDVALRVRRIASFGSRFVGACGGVAPGRAVVRRLRGESERPRDSHRGHAGSSDDPPRAPSGQPHEPAAVTESVRAASHEDGPHPVGVRTVGVVVQEARRRRAGLVDTSARHIESWSCPTSSERAGQPAEHDVPQTQCPTAGSRTQ